jgi:malate dehydrogenase (quinone)
MKIINPLLILFIPISSFLSKIYLANRSLFPHSIHMNNAIECDAVMIGAGIMSATLATFLKELNPNIKIEIFEKLDQIAAESSAVLNNAGTGHSALCELNYSPQNADGTVGIDKAIHILEMFEVSKQFWSYLVEQSYFALPENFIHSVPHVSFVWGEKNVAYLKTRYETMKHCHLFKDIEYSEDHDRLTEWMPLIMKGQNLNRPVAASRNKLGTDLNFEAITHALIQKLMNEEVSVSLRQEVKNLKRDGNGFWNLEIKDLTTQKTRKVKTKFVFIGAGGNALPLLEESGVDEVKGYGGFPVGGQWLICKNQEIIDQHHAKVYGQATVGAPPMSVPHLDTRMINGKKALLFGPFATFSFKFLKTGSQWDLLGSLLKSPRLSNAIPMLSAGFHNIPLTQYLIEQLRLSFSDKVNELREFVPDAQEEDWESHDAGQRVQIIKRPPETEKRGQKKSPAGILEFGTEVVASHDGTLAALLGASPGASSAVSIMLEILEKCFTAEMKTEAWQNKIKKMIPTHGQSLLANPELTRATRERTHRILRLKLP